MTTRPDPRMFSGTCFEYDGSGVSPFVSDYERWDIEMYEPTGREQWLGKRKVDGAVVCVFHCPEDNCIRAQLAHMCHSA